MKNKINILLIGSGGREHALANKILQSKKCNQVYAIPGNKLWANVISEENIKLNDNKKIVSYAKEKQIDLVIIGPEDALKNGLADDLNANNILTFGPNKIAAKIETNKDFSKHIMDKYNIPTAKYESFKDFTKAKNYVNSLNDKNFLTVIKSSNLAAGKGVYITKSKSKAINYLDELLNKNKYDSNNTAVIEEFLTGDEFSLMCLVNGNKIYPLPAVKDHKRAFSNDKGPNTGGMGVISDPIFLQKEDNKLAVEKCIKPLVDGLIKEKINYLGIIFAGLIKTKNNEFKVIEYNARWGDPETEIVLQKIDCDIVEFILAVTEKKEFQYNERKNKISGVVVCAKGYPKAYDKNIDLNFLKNEKNIFYMGARTIDNKILSNGGRIFMLWEEDENDPSKIIYNKIKKWNLKETEFHFRNDIDWTKKLI